MKYEALICDLDGTLVRSLPEHRYNVVCAALKDLGVIASKADIDMFWFETERDTIVIERFGVANEDFWPRYREHDKIDVRARFTKPYDDVEFLKEVRKKGIKTGIVTGAPSHILELEVNMLGKENFDSIISAHRLNGIIPKPDPQGLMGCLNDLKVSQTKAIYLGNGDEDIQTARNAGVFDILIDRGEYKFPNTNPSMIIKSLYELKDFLGI